MESENVKSSQIRDKKWGFPKMGVPQNGWSKRGNPIKMDDLGVLPPM